MLRRALFPLLVSLLLANAGAWASEADEQRERAEATRIDVRVKSKGAKFVGTSMGGAQVVVRDHRTGAILAQGVTRGSTGDTSRIMRAPRKAGEPLSTPDAAVFRAEIEIDEPTPIRVEAFGPLAQPQATARVSVTQWVVPGKHITGGDGLMLELPGFVVDALSPPAHAHLSGPTVDVKANVVMMCGCPIEPGGLWDADRFEVRVILRRDGERVAEEPLEFAGQTSQFQRKLTIDQPGTYEATVYAYDPENGNTGLDKTSFIVTPEP